jgi:hypothetical protein
MVIERQFPENLFSAGDPLITALSTEALREAYGQRNIAGAEVAVQAPHINVKMQDTNENASVTLPTAIIQTDGSVQTLKDGNLQTVIDKDGNILDTSFLTTVPKSDVTIEVQRNGDQTALSAEQRRGLNLLADKLAHTIATNYESNLPTIETRDGQAIAQVTIEDPSHLVSEAVEQKYGNDILEQDIARIIPAEIIQSLSNPGPAIGPQTVRTVYDVNYAFPRGTSGEMPASRAARFYRHRTVAPDEGDDAHYLNMLASLARRPVDSARYVKHGGYKFGLYDTGPRTFANWFEGFLSPEILRGLGNPPDLSKLAGLLKEDPTRTPTLLAQLQTSLKDKGAPKELQSKFAKADSAQKFAEFVNKLVTSEGRKISAAEMEEMMPESLQSRIALDTVKSYKKDGANPKPSDIELAYLLDKNPSELTDADRRSTESKEIARASGTLYGLSRAKQGARGNDTIHWSADINDPDAFHAALIKAAKRYQDQTDDGCAKTFARAFYAATGGKYYPFGNGLDAFRNAARIMCATGKYEMREIKTNEQACHAIFIGQEWSESTIKNHHGYKYGHVSAMTPNGIEVSSRDYVFDVCNRRYRTTWGVFAKETPSQNSVSIRPTQENLQTPKNHALWGLFELFGTFQL